jgi:hypothetical protein
MTPWCEEGQMLKFVDWLINRSPWEQVFIDKNPARVIKLGYLVDAQQSSSFVCSAMVASRFMTESYSGESWQSRVKVYQELLDMGCSENEAFMFAHMFNSTEWEKNLYPIVFSRLSSGHSTFYGSCYGREYILNFLKGTPVNLSGETLSNCAGYPSDSINKTWGRATKTDRFAEDVKSLRPLSDSVKTEYNIFKINKSQEFEYSSRGDFLSVISQLKEIIYA